MCDVQPACVEVPVSRDCSQAPCVDCSAPAGFSAGVPTQCVVDQGPICTVAPEQAQCGQGPCCCARPECCSQPACCYVQPPRAAAYKPATAYVRPTAPMEGCSVYKLSYPGSDACTAKMVRGAPIKPKDNIFSSSAKMETCTVQNLSFQPNCGVSPPTPIKPRNSRLIGDGPMQSVTTQKHDYVPKPVCMRQPIKAADHVPKTTAPLEKVTVTQLSFPPIDIKCYPPPKPIKQDPVYQRPEGPTENCTVYKLSYMPNCPGPKEEFPWAKQVRHAPPPYTDLGTVYKYSYLPNCNVARVSPLGPYCGLKIVGDGPPAKDTIYKGSYFCPNGSRPDPIKPKDCLGGPTGKMDSCTVYKLSYIPNCNVKRTMPIKPPTQTRRSCEPMQSVTTQKHDFVPKPICRPKSLKQPDHFFRPNVPMETCTVNRLSYMPNPCYERPKPIKPDSGYRPVQGPPESCTTYKLSYMPNCVPPKEELPWVPKTTYCRPTVPMDTCTVQKLSYMPPGRFLDKCCCSCSCKPNMQNMARFPKAAIC